MNNYRKKLLALKQSLLMAQETGDQAEQTVELDQACVGRLSRMDAMQAQAMSIETGRRRRMVEEVQRIIAAQGADDTPGKALVDPEQLNEPAGSQNAAGRLESEGEKGLLKRCRDGAQPFI